MAETMPLDTPTNEIESPSTSLAEDNTPTQVAPPTSVVFDAPDTPGVSALTESGAAELAALTEASAPAPRRGRRKKETPKAETAGVDLFCRIGDRVTRGQPLYRIHATNTSELEFARHESTHHHGFTVDGTGAVPVDPFLEF